MSWSLQYGSLEDFKNDKPTYPIVGEVEEHVQEQIAAAREAAALLIESGMAGGEDKDFFINLNGHANPNHEPATGYANDMVGVSISQKSAA